MINESEGVYVFTSLSRPDEDIINETKAVKLRKAEAFVASNAPGDFYDDGTDNIIPLHDIGKSIGELTKNLISTP